MGEELLQHIFGDLVGQPLHEEDVVGACLLLAFILVAEVAFSLHLEVGGDLGDLLAVFELVISLQNRDGVGEIMRELNGLTSEETSYHALAEEIEVVEVALCQLGGLDLSEDDEGLTPHFLVLFGDDVQYFPILGEEEVH